ncbi:leucine-rich repeat flightless-interacting protein 2-like [Limulus polyphemus]|uniref:Leucine-rich repeat flightless-interacting protein 2-like n=1 Tax=Limulus polyphemus TaxID=6850 RepID=A0ABM1BJ07_LIMPO|nr:leucine-rich repeat flightless-interacting protein 2-like [Limulus polyphemus]
MASVGSGRKRATTKLYSAENEALDQIAREAEARLAARRQARAEAREIRMRELEKQQKEADQQSDRHYELHNDTVRGRPTREGRSSSFVSNASSYTSSRRSSEDSTDVIENSRELKHQLQDIEEKFKKAMVSNAQLDNEKSSLTYNVDTLKDEIEEMEENYIQIKKDCKEKYRAYDQLQRDFKEVKEEIEFLKEGLRQRDELIEDHGLVLVGGQEFLVNGDVDGCSSRSTPDSSASKSGSKIALVNQVAGEGSLDFQLKRFAEEKQELLDEIRRLKLDLEEERQKTAKMEQLTLVHGPQSNGPEMKLLEVQRETNKQVSDYKFKLKKLEQENSTLLCSVTRLEGQVIRYKTATENAEKVEDEIKAEKRKLQREVREAQARIEELETANAHLQKRIDKLKSARNALVK